MNGKTFNAEIKKQTADLDLAIKTYCDESSQDFCLEYAARELMANAPYGIDIDQIIAEGAILYNWIIIYHLDNF